MERTKRKNEHIQALVTESSKLHQEDLLICVNHNPEDSQLRLKSVKQGEEAFQKSN